MVSNRFGVMTLAVAASFAAGAAGVSAQSGSVGGAIGGTVTAVPVETQSCPTVTAMKVVGSGGGLMTGTSTNGVVAIRTADGTAGGGVGNVIIARAATADGSAAPVTAVYSRVDGVDGATVKLIESKDASGDAKSATVATKYHVKRPPARSTNAQVVEVDGTMIRATPAMASAGGAGGSVASFTTTATGDNKPVCVITVRGNDGGN